MKTVGTILVIVAVLVALWFINDVVMGKHGGNTACDNTAQDYRHCQ